MLDISIVIPGIRTERWMSLYQSICKSTKRNFELILCGPYSPPREMSSIKNLKYVRDFGSPVRASNIAASLSEGYFITWGADDATYTDNSLDLLIDRLISKNNIGSIVLCKYLEGPNGTQKTIQPDNYFTLNGTHWTSSHNFQNNWYLFNVGLMGLKVFEFLNGWDCKYKGTFYSHSDMAARAYYQNFPISFENDIILLDCDHFNDRDHPIIEKVQTTEDIRIFKDKWNKSNIENENLYEIKSWKDSPSIWERFYV